MPDKLLRVAMYSIVPILILLVVVGALGRPSAQGENPYPTLPPEKQAALDKEDALRQAAENSLDLSETPKPIDTPRESPIPTPTGIIQMGDLAIHGNPYLFQNHWAGNFDGHYIQVYAGALNHDPKQGILYVNPPITGVFGVYESPTQDGSLKIVEVSDNFVFTMQADDGTLMTFDLNSRAWGSSQSTPSPTPVVQPTDSPIATPTLEPLPTTPAG